jgi:Kef-type K+ transport system membrane component KefB
LNAHDLFDQRFDCEIGISDQLIMVFFQFFQGNEFDTDSLWKMKQNVPPITSSCCLILLPFSIDRVSIIDAKKETTKESFFVKTKVSTTSFEF